MKKLRVGVIGLGMGAYHLTQYAKHPQVELAAIADPDTRRREEARERFGISGLYADALDMLRSEQLDIVSVCTPNCFHKSLSIAAMEAGAHVICEKPMAMNAAEGREMLEASRRTGRRLMINFSYRFNDQSFALKRQVETGILGDIYFGRTIWHRRRGFPRFGGWFGQKTLSGGGPLIDLGVHRLDLALWLMDYPKPTWVMGATFDALAREKAGREGAEFDVEDLAAASIRFENGAMLMVEASWAVNQKDNEWMETQLFGTKGGLTQGLRRKVAEEVSFEAELHLESLGCQFDMKLHPPVPEAKSAMAHFVDAILTDTPHIATGEEGLVVMELLDAIYESACTGAPVRIGEV